jgi:hypothetical protein
LKILGYFKKFVESHFYEKALSSFTGSHWCNLEMVSESR